ncbi:E3 ubiquitin-protein ligase RNF12-B-like [Zootermopsis nevadensis]|nr:E3 ubiquitin-protein ligase RNF12-B-like [Zootermopsis nevadensis]
MLKLVEFLQSWICIVYLVVIYSAIGSPKIKGKLQQLSESNSKRRPIFKHKNVPGHVHKNRHKYEANKMDGYNHHEARTFTKVAVMVPAEEKISEQYLVEVPARHHSTSEKEVSVPVHPVEAQILADRRYPVEIPAPVDHPYPVEVSVSKPQSYPDKIPVHGLQSYSFQFEVPVEQTYPRIVEKDDPIIKHIPVEIPVPVEVKVPVPEPYPVEVPVYVPVQVNVPYLVYVPVEIMVPVQVKPSV